MSGPFPLPQSSTLCQKGQQSGRGRRGVGKEDNIQVLFTPPVPRPARELRTPRDRDQKSETCPPSTLRKFNSTNARPFGQARERKDQPSVHNPCQGRLWPPRVHAPKLRFGHTRKPRNGTRLGGARGPEKAATEHAEAETLRAAPPARKTCPKMIPWEGAPQLRSGPPSRLRRRRGSGCIRTRVVAAAGRDAMTHITGLLMQRSR